MGAAAAPGPTTDRSPTGSVVWLGCLPGDVFRSGVAVDEDGQLPLRLYIADPGHGARRRGLRVRTLQYLDVPAFDLVDGDSTTARSRQPRSSPAALHPSHRVGNSDPQAGIDGTQKPDGEDSATPRVTIPLFLFSYYGIYLSPVFDLVASSWVGHTGLELFFLATGVLFIVPVLSSGPLPVKQSNLGRCFDLFVEMPLHVFIGVILMMATSPLLSTFTNPPASWNVDLMADQQMAGALAWSYGEPVALIIMVVFAMRWNRDETRTNAAVDKKAARDGDVDLEAYNEFLKTLPRR